MLRAVLTPVLVLVPRTQASPPPPSRERPAGGWGCGGLWKGGRRPAGLEMWALAQVQVPHLISQQDRAISIYPTSQISAESPPVNVPLRAARCESGDSYYLFFLVVGKYLWES